MANGAVMAVILDVDGTLVDSNDAHARAWVEAFAEHGIAVPFENVRRAIGMGGDKLMPSVAGISEDSKEGESTFVPSPGSASSSSAFAPTASRLPSPVPPRRTS